MKEETTFTLSALDKEDEDEDEPSAPLTNPVTLGITQVLDLTDKGEESEPFCYSEEVRGGKDTREDGSKLKLYPSKATIDYYEARIIQNLKEPEQDIISTTATTKTETTDNAETGNRNSLSPTTKDKGEDEDGDEPTASLTNPVSLGITQVLDLTNKGEESEPFCYNSEEVRRMKKGEILQAGGEASPNVNNSNVTLLSENSTMQIAPDCAFIGDTLDRSNVTSVHRSKEYDPKRTTQPPSDAANPNLLPGAYSVRGSNSSTANESADHRSTTVLVEAEIVSWDDVLQEARQQVEEELRTSLEKAQVVVASSVGPVITTTIPPSKGPPRGLLGHQVTNKKRLSTSRLKNQSSESRLDMHDEERGALQNLSSVGLYGRDVEQKMLQHQLDAMMNDGRKQNQLVLISGLAGSGKSKLAGCLQQSTIVKQGLFVSGKFESQQKVPYAAIVAACSEICDEAIIKLSLSESSICTFRERIVETLGGELQTFLTMIPSLQGCFGDASLYNNEMVQTLNNGPGGKARLQYAFCALIRLFADYFRPLVLVLDDLQLADEDSLALLRMVISGGEENYNIMIVGTYRSNEVDQAHPLSILLDQLRRGCILQQQEEETGGFFVMNELSIGNLTEPSGTKVIMETLSLDQPKAARLRGICFQKTRGNPFFLVQFISMLIKNQILYYQNGEWEWEEEEIRERLGATKNVVHMLKTRMKDLSEDARLVIELASCMGFKFYKREIRLVWVDLCLGKRDAIELLETILESLQRDGFIEAAGLSGYYVWSHNKIQEAAIQLLPPQERASFRRRVGGILLVQLSESELESMIFVVANLLNDNENRKEKKENIVLAKLNLRASKKAVAFSAFESAAYYIEHGVNHLGHNCWNSHSKLALELYSGGAEAENYLGNISRMESYSNAVLGQDSLSLEEKLRVYNALLDNMGNRGNQTDEAIHTCADILGQLGCRFPLTGPSIKLHLILNLARIKFRAMKPDRMQKISRMEDKNKLHSIKLVDKLVTFCHSTSHPLAPLAALRLYNWTTKYGFHDYSPISFATVGIIFAGVLFDLKNGASYGRHALSLLETFDSPTVEAKTALIVYMLILHWQEPARDMVAPLLQAHDKGMKSGDIDSAMWAANGVVALRFIMGAPLKSVEEDCRNYVTKMTDLKREKPLHSLRIQYQTILNLIQSPLTETNVDNLTSVSGQVISQEEIDHLIRQDPLIAAKYPVMKGILYTYFGAYENYAKQSLQRGGDLYHKLSAGNPNAPLETFLIGISCLAAASLEKPGFKGMGKKMRARIHSWVKKGNPNVVHYSKLLDAEWAALEKRSSTQVASLYRDAISLSLREGYIQDAALSTERLALYQIETLSDSKGGLKSFQLAIDYYREWGAMAKVAVLEGKLATLIDQIENV